MSRPASLTAFFVTAVVAFLLLTLAWMKVSAWTSHPVAGIAHVVLGNAAGNWIRSIEKAPGRLEVHTRIAVAAPAGMPAGRAELVIEADPAHFAYGLPLYLALLIAGGGRFARKAVAGYLALLLPQAFSLCFDILKQIMVAGGGPAALGIAPWRMEAIALGYQIGALLMPTVAPVALWLWLDRGFLRSVIVEGWLKGNLGAR